MKQLIIAITLFAITIFKTNAQDCPNGIITIGKVDTTIRINPAGTRMTFEGSSTRGIECQCVQWNVSVILNITCPYWNGFTFETLFATPRFSMLDYWYLPMSRILL